MPLGVIGGSGDRPLGAPALLALQAGPDAAVRRTARLACRAVLPVPGVRAHQTELDAARASVVHAPEWGLPVIARCACGWKRPLIAVVFVGGPPPPELPAIVPAYNCPNCGAPYISTECSLEQTDAILQMLDACRQAIENQRGRRN